MISARILTICVKIIMITAKTLIFYLFYKQNVIMTIKMLLKPLVLQHFRKKKLCGCSAVVRATTKLQPQSIFFRKCCKTNGFSNFFRQP